MTFINADATRLPFADKSFDLVFGSPPYCDARLYGVLGIKLRCEAWIDWMLRVTREAVRVSRGLVLWVCAGVTRKHCYWPACEGLLYRWWADGGQCWRPAFWHRVGIPGSGGKQWLRADVEYVLAFKGPGTLSWADNTANGHPPKWAPGGEMSHRLANGERVNGWDAMFAGGNGARGQGRNKNGDKNTKPRLKRVTRGSKNGDTITSDSYKPPVLANPGVLIRGIRVGGGLMGHPLAHKNEAPFPLRLAQYFIRGWCQPDGLVLDPFSGSGTTVHAALSLGRRAVGCDLRMDQCLLGQRRIAGGVQLEAFG